MTRENDVTKDWVRTKDALFYLAPESGASIDKAHGVLIGAVCIMMDTHKMRQSDAFDYLVRQFPDNFRLECVPYSWLGLNRAIQPDDLTKVSSFSALWNGLPDEEKEKSENLREDLITRYINVIATMINQSDRAEVPEMKMFPFTKQGNQWIADWAVYDRAKEHVPGRSNFHGQNPSQWQYAGCILIQDGRVSVHT